MLSSLNACATRGIVQFGPLNFPCALGRGGRLHIKREGDGGTPVGRWPLLEVIYRPDRLMRPFTRLPLRAMRRDDGWCDAPRDRNYNRNVVLPYRASAETMWRDDDLYNLVVVLNHNYQPRIRGAGSAIFMHLARTGKKTPGYLPTQGCIALKRDHLLTLLAAVRPDTALLVKG